MRFIAEHYSEANLEPVDDAQLFQWLEAHSATDPKMAALVATLQGQDISELPLPLQIELTDRPDVDYQLAQAPPPSSGPDAIARRFLDAEPPVFAANKTGPILAVSNAPKVPAIVQEMRAQLDAQWGTKGGEFRVTDSEAEPMPPGPALP
jgi:hypothetical protein